MLLSTAERDRRWAAARSLMQEADVDVLIASSDAGDHVPGHQRYLSGYRSMFWRAVVMLFRDDVELIVDAAGTDEFAKRLSWIEEPISTVKNSVQDSHWYVDKLIKTTVGGPSVGLELADQLNRRGATRIGVADLEHFPTGWEKAIVDNVDGATFIELGPELNRLRWTKSAEEVGRIREGARIASEIWARMPELMAVGRHQYEVLADIEHMILSQGGEHSFNLLLLLPIFVDGIERMPNEGSSRRLQKGDLYTIEVSPRISGYYAQLTAPVSIGTIDPETRAAYEAIVRGREAGVRLMKPGVDILDVKEAVAQQLRQDGYELSSPLIGHVCGLELDEVRVGTTSLTLEAGMTIILHPFVAGFPILMRADTYLINEDGYEQLTNYPFSVLELDA